MRFRFPRLACRFSQQPFFENEKFFLLEPRSVRHLGYVAIAGRAEPPPEHLDLHLIALEELVGISLQKRMSQTLPNRCWIGPVSKHGPTTDRFVRVAEIGVAHWIKEKGGMLVSMPDGCSRRCW